MTETARIIDQLQRAFSGAAWSGPSLLSLLVGLSARQAVARPVADAHSIWELVRHLRSWQDVARRRLEAGRQVTVTDAEDWPRLPPAPDDDAWRQEVKSLRASQAELLAAVATLSDDQLNTRLLVPDSEPATGQSVYVLLHGVAQHTLYHAGQIALLRKALGQ